jgi:Sorting nexin C terminal
LEHLSADSIAGWIHFGLDMLWPDGVFFQSSPPLTASELVAEAEKAKSVLHESFPDALRTILGQDLTKDGLDIFYEMLQNRVVVKSMAYMLFDVLWLEIFPEIGDLLQGGAALDMDNNN